MQIETFLTGGLTRRALLGTAAAALGVASLPAYASASPVDLSGVTLRVGTFRGQDETILSGTKLDRTPYTTQYNEFNAGNLITQAINADALDLGGWSEIPLVFAAASNANIRVVAVLAGPTSSQAVLVPKGSPVKSIGDLRGKRVGYVRATTAHYFLLKMLAQHDMTFADIEPIALGMSSGLTAMKSGALDAWATYGYAIATIETDSGARVLQNAVGILSGNYLIGVNPKRLFKPADRSAIADYVGRLDRAYRILDADKSRWARLVAPVIGIPEPIVLAYLKDENSPWLLHPIRPADIASAQNVADTFSKVGLLPPKVDVAPYFTSVLDPLLITRS